jgi:UDP-N-acetylglucosamine 1-carboxyvinyltransferase
LYFFPNQLYLAVLYLLLNGMSKLIIHGGKKLQGTVRPVPNKNSIIKLIPAALLTDEDVVIHNTPKTSDVIYMLKILEKLWWKYERLSDDTVRINSSDVNSFEIDAELSDKMKASVMFLWPLLVRFGKAMMPTPQWCKLGTRPLDAFIGNMEKMWAIFTHEWGMYGFETKELKGTKVRSWEPSVTGTENLILLAVRTPGITTIYNAACEPHTQDLCNMLVAMGAKISGIWSNLLIIEWVDKLHWCEWTVISDHLDVAWFIAAAAMTGWEITITNAVTIHMDLMLETFEKLGIKTIIDRNADTIFVPSQQTREIEKTVKWDHLMVRAQPWPMLPMDIIHTFAVVAMSCHWSAIFMNIGYEYAWFFVEELAKMKGRTIMADPHRIVTFWPTERQPANVVCSDIIQSAYGLLLAALAAPGTSTLNAITPLFRRFPNFVEQFRSLGADIEFIE